MKFAELKERLEEVDEKILLAEGFEDALVGYAEGWFGGSRGHVAVYDRAKCIKILMRRDKMSEEGAEEFFDFNVAGSYVGEKTPVFMTILR